MGRREDVNHLKFLFDAFLPEYYWTEVMECLRKLLLTGFVVFFYEGSALQVVFGLSISMIFLALYSFLQPYLMPSNNTFASFVHFQISFTLMSALLLRISLDATQSQEDSWRLSEETISIALLISNVSVLVVGIFYIIRSIFFVSEKELQFLKSGGALIVPIGSTVTSPIRQADGKDSKSSSSSQKDILRKKRKKRQKSENSKKDLSI